MNKISVVEATTRDQMQAVASLLRDYLLWMRRRYVRHPEMIESFFDETEWASELSDLQGHYGAPHGAIVLASHDGAPAGCVLMRGIGPDVCEMKRLFVRPAFHRQGIARLMVERLLKLSCDRGYHILRLETGVLQTEAHGLYRAMGFIRTAPYHPVPRWHAATGSFFKSEPCGCPEPVAA